jgi:hypothetical protein
MSLNNPKGGIGYAGEFQSSALPFVTSSVAPQATSGCLRIDLPKISRTLTVSNLDGTNKLRVGFTRNGILGSNYYLVGPNATVTLELRVTAVYFAGDSSSPAFAFCGGLTNIDAVEMPQLSGTLGDGSAGWQGVG